LSIYIEFQHIVLRTQREREKLRGLGVKKLELENQVRKFGQLRTVIRNHVFQVTLISFLLGDGNLPARISKARRSDKCRCQGWPCSHFCTCLLSVQVFQKIYHLGFTTPFSHRIIKLSNNSIAAKYSHIGWAKWYLWCRKTEIPGLFPENRKID